MCKAIEIGKRGDALRYHPGVFPSGVENTPKIAIFRMCYGKNGTVKFLETLADNVFRHNYSMMQIF
jgi:hypothetical protein